MSARTRGRKWRRASTCETMNIPVQNIYYLLCYAWDTLQEEDIVDVDLEDNIEWLDLFARVLINGTTHLFRKGLDREYRSTEDEYRGVKGKLLFGPSIKRNLLDEGKACCDYDELDHNVLHNQILKTTLARLIALDHIDPKIQDDLLLLYSKFPNVDETELAYRHFERVKLHRNNHFYDFLLRICRIVYESGLINETAGSYKFMDFFRDEKRMGELFETFVRNFYRKEQGEYEVGREHIKWACAATGKDDIYLPLMKTDISLTSKKEKRKIIIETKYYSTGFKAPSWIGSQEKAISPHLYQLFAYLKNLEHCGGVNQTCEGMLLYATVDQDVTLRFSLPAHDVSIQTLNLNKPWQEIHRDLLSIL